MEIEKEKFEEVLDLYLRVIKDCNNNQDYIPLHEFRVRCRNRVLTHVEEKDEEITMLKLIINDLNSQIANGLNNTKAEAITNVNIQ